LGDALALLGRRVLAEHEQHRIADEAKQREGDQPDREHHEDRLGEAPEDIGEHGWATSRYLTLP